MLLSRETPSIPFLLASLVMMPFLIVSEATEKAEAKVNALIGKRRPEANGRAILRILNIRNFFYEIEASGRKGTIIVG